MVRRWSLLLRVRAERPRHCHDCKGHRHTSGHLLDCRESGQAIDGVRQTDLSAYHYRDRHRQRFKVSLHKLCNHRDLEMEIAPDKQNIDLVFSNTTYYIDFYQRDYRWTDESVKRLLNDIFFRFRDRYERSKNLEPSKETITKQYPWYYLNTYVTNIVNGRVYIVDGQQRLTTLSLILMRLLHLAERFDSILWRWIQAKISGHSGFDQEFWMNHAGHKAVQQAS